MFKKSFFILYGCFLLLFSFFSYGFVDPNFPLPKMPMLYGFVNQNHIATTSIYSICIVLSFVFYAITLWLLKRKKLDIRNILILVTISTLCLLPSFPAFSNDIFNYIATAKVSFLYKENPYIVMPIEITNEPMLVFLQASNKIALYGPGWILLTFVPHMLGMGNLIGTMFLFKLFVTGFYVGLLWLLWKISSRSIWSVAFFGLNPVVLVETLVSSHNDIAMMFFALLAFYFLKRSEEKEETPSVRSGRIHFLQRKQMLLAIIAIIASILIKYATVFLLPVFIYAMYSLARNRKIHWQSIWFWSAISMYIIFFLSPLREEIYAWYFIWILPFVALFTKFNLLTAVSIAFSFGLLFRIAPFLYTKSWIGITPLIKKVVTFIPPAAVLLGYVLKKKV